MSIRCLLTRRCSTGRCRSACRTRCRPTEWSAGAHGVVCLGTVAIDGGVPPDGVALAPSQQGEVTEVLVYENQSVQKGTILLRVDDEPAQKAVVQAESGVRIAEAQLIEARQGLERHRALVEAQQAAVNGAKFKVEAGEADVRPPCRAGP